MDDLAVELRLCEHCLDVKPLMQFRPVCKDHSRRAKVCNACHAAKERLRLQQQKSKANRKRLGKIITAIVTERDQKRVQVLLRVAAQQFGGTFGLAQEYAKFYQEAPAGSFRRFRALQLAISLLPERPAAPDASDMSDQELHDAMMGHVQSYIAEFPQAALLAAHQLGWAVIPPGGSEYVDSAGE